MLFLIEPQVAVVAAVIFERVARTSRVKPRRSALFERADDDALVPGRSMS